MRTTALCDSSLALAIIRATPVRSLPRLLVQRIGDHALDLAVADGARGSWSAH